VRYFQRLLVAASVLITLPLALAQTKCPDKQTPVEIDQRVDALIANMTLAERIAQLQDRAPAIPRLHLPAYNWWNEGLHGLARDGFATVFPQAIGLAATWDPTLLRQVGDVISTEARAHFNEHAQGDSPRYGGLTIWSPNINIFRDPRWGRGQETYGEDPYLTGALAMQFVAGIQGNDPFYRKADATPKHFAVHSGPERGRDSFNAVVSPHDLEDTYFRAFRAVTGEGHADALMCSYNEINGVPSCASPTNLGSMLRDQWGFHGYVVSDCDAVGDIASYHHYATDSAHGAAAALNAGVDLDCGRTYAALNRSVADGLTTEANVNRALHRLLEARIRLGMMDDLTCSPYGKINTATIDSSAHRALALRAAEESMVLLKNDGVLPLAAGKRIAVVGASADMLKILEANYHGTASRPVTPLEGLRSKLNVVGYAQGSLLAEGLPALVPRTALRTGAQASAPAGMTAEFFNGPVPEGLPVLSTTVAKIDADIDREAFTPRQTAKQYSARWSGYVTPPAAGSYVFRVDVERCWDCTTHDQFRLYVDGKVALDSHGAKGEGDRVTLQFADTTPHAIRLDYMHTGEDEGVALEWVPPANVLLEEAVHAAANADVIVAFAGLSPDLEGEALQLDLQGFDGGDRTTLDLPATQRALLTRLRALGKPMVLVLTSGSAVSLGPEASNANAVLEAWYPGEAGGEALANLLKGTANPSGRLPVTFYRSAADLPSFTDYSMAHRTYRYFDGPVLYPFGFGLSYTRFQYASVRLSGKRIHAEESMAATVRVANTGKVAGDEVVELYLQTHIADAPRIELAGTQRVQLQPGEARELKFTLTPEQLSTVDTSGHRAVRPGSYSVFIHGHQPDTSSEKGTLFSIVK
jgi:beta-glucosidase